MSDAIASPTTSPTIHPNPIQSDGHHSDHHNDHHHQFHHLPAVVTPLFGLLFGTASTGSSSNSSSSNTLSNGGGIIVDASATSATATAAASISTTENIIGSSASSTAIIPHTIGSLFANITSSIEDGPSSSLDAAASDSIALICFEVVLGLVLCVLIVTTVIGNTLIILAVLTTRRLRTVTNCFVMSLAMADWMVGLFVMPPAVAVHLIGSWRLGSGLCALWISLDVLLCTASILSLCAISIDRYLAVTQPLAYSRRRRSKRLALSMILVVWVLAVAITCPPILWGWDDSLQSPNKCSYNQNEGYVIFSAMGSFFIPMAVMIYVYVRISCVVAQRHDYMYELEMNKPGNPPHNQHHSHHHHPQDLEQQQQLHTNQHTTDDDIELDIDQSSEQENSSPYHRRDADYDDDGDSDVVGKGSVPNIKLYGIDAASPLAIATAVTSAVKGQYELVAITDTEPDAAAAATIAETTTAPTPQPLAALRSDGRPQRTNRSRLSVVLHVQPNSSRASQRSTATITTMLAPALMAATASAITSSATTAAASTGKAPPSSGPRCVHQSNHSLLQPPIGPPTVAQHTSHNKSVSHRIKSLKRESKTTQTLSIVVGGFIICWLPFFVYYLITPFLPERLVNMQVTYGLTWLGWFNSAMNPFIYAFYSVDFRTAFWRLTLRRFFRDSVKAAIPLTPSGAMSMRR